MGMEMMTGGWGVHTDRFMAGSGGLDIWQAGMGKFALDTLSFWGFTVWGNSWAYNTHFSFQHIAF